MMSMVLCNESQVSISYIEIGIFFQVHLISRKCNIEIFRFTCTALADFRSALFGHHCLLEFIQNAGVLACL